MDLHAFFIRADAKLPVTLPVSCAAPRDPASGRGLHVRLGDLVPVGHPLFTVHGQAPGQPEYATPYAISREEIVAMEDT